MDNKQAAAVLRTHADITRKMQESAVDCMVADAAERGAEAIEMLEWLWNYGMAGECWDSLSAPAKAKLLEKWR